MRRISPIIVARPLVAALTWGCASGRSAGVSPAALGPGTPAEGTDCTETSTDAPGLAFLDTVAGPWTGDGRPPCVDDNATVAPAPVIRPSCVASR